MGHGLLSVRRGGGFSALLRSGGVCRGLALFRFWCGRGVFPFLSVLAYESDSDGNGKNADCGQRFY